MKDRSEEVTKLLEDLADAGWRIRAEPEQVRFVRRTDTSRVRAFVPAELRVRLRDDPELLAAIHAHLTAQSAAEERRQKFEASLVAGEFTGTPWYSPRRQR